MLTEKEVLALANSSGFGNFQNAVLKSANVGFREGETPARPSTLGSPNFGRTIMFLLSVTIQNEGPVNMDRAGIRVDSADGTYNWYYSFLKAGTQDAWPPVSLTPNCFCSYVEVASRAGADVDVDVQILYWELSN